MAETHYRKERIDRGIKARCEDVFILLSYEEILYMALPRILPFLVVLILPLALITSGQIYWQKVMVISCVIALLALSWDLLASTVRFISLGQAFFFGVGSYIAGGLDHYFGLSPLFTIPVATLGGAALCTLLLSPVLRLKGLYFSLITLAYPLMFIRIIEATEILGGTEGLSGLSWFPNVWAESYLSVTALFACLFGFRRLINSDYGLVLRGIGENDRVVMSRGANIYWYKAQALFIASGVGAFTGAFMTHFVGFVGMPAFALEYSILPLACVFLGGSGTFAGAVLGAFILTPLSEVLRMFGTLRIAIYSLIVIASIVGLPEGIFHYLQRKYHQFERMVGVEVKE